MIEAYKEYVIKDYFTDKLTALRFVIQHHMTVTRIPNYGVRYMGVVILLTEHDGTANRIKPLTNIEMMDALTITHLKSMESWRTMAVDEHSTP